MESFLFENPSIRTTETRFHEPARLSTPPKPLFSLKPLDATRHNLVEVVVNSAERELKVRAAQKYSKVAFGCPEVASESPEVASELIRDIFEFFDLSFQGKEIIMRKYYFWK